MWQQLRLFLLPILILSTIDAARGADDRSALVSAIAEGRGRIRELAIVRDVLRRHNVRGWLLGGSAASLAHYVYDDLLRTRGQQEFPSGYYDYDFYSVFRMTQDVDIVIDGTEAQAKAIQTELERRLPYTMPSFLQYKGKSSIWEVRLLRGDIQGKVAILDNPQFFWQHSDSDSNGLIELTDAPRGESIVRDVREWEKQEENHFLRGVVDRELYYYFSERHGDTTRAQKGKNPPIMSVVRYLAKHFQFGTHTAPSAVEKLRAIGDAFDPTALRPHAGGPVSYAEDRLRRLATKLILNARDREAAWNAIEALRLRKKLAALDDKGVKESLASYLRHSPLSSKELGEGGGKTAGELGIGVVVIGITDYLTFESLRHAAEGEPNLPSYGYRLGEGDDTKVRGVVAFREAQGARAEGLPVRLTLRSEAREGSDFLLHGEVLIVLNRAAVRVVSEDLSPTPVAWFEGLRAGSSLRFKDKRLSTLVQRRLASAVRARPAVARELRAIVEKELESGAPSPRVLGEWFRLPLSARYPDLLVGAIAKPGPWLPAILSEVWRNRAWAAHMPKLLPDFARALLVSLEKQEEHGYGYLSTNGQTMHEWLGAAVEVAPGNDTALLFLEALQAAVAEKQITFRDFRRLAARALGVARADEAFLERFHALFSRSPELRRAFAQYRGSFADSKQVDAKAVEAVFLALEKSLGCAGLLAAAEEKRVVND